LFSEGAAWPFLLTVSSGTDDALIAGRGLFHVSGFGRFKGTSGATPRHHHRLQVFGSGNCVPTAQNTL
jgi:hypothetical protein